MKQVKKFYNPIEGDDSYYLFELQYILGVSRRTLYRIVKTIKAPTYKRKRRRKIKTIELLQIVGTTWFKKYIKKLRQTEEKDNENTLITFEIDYYAKLPRSKRNLMLKRPHQLVHDGLVSLTINQVQDAIFAGLIPTFEVAGTCYIQPNFINCLMQKE